MTSKIFATFVAVLLTGSPAFASGPVVVDEQQSATVPALYDWSGSYLGLGLGGLLSDHDFTAGFPNLVITSRAAVSLLGGRNWQGGGNVVRGAEFMVSSGTTGQATCPNPALQCHAQVGPSLSIRGRLGLAVGNNTMIFATAGLIGATITHGTTSTFGNFFTSQMQTGFTIGLGVEHAMDSGWNLRGDIEYSDFGAATFRIDQPQIPYQISTTTTAVRLTLVRRF